MEGGTKPHSPCRSYKCSGSAHGSNRQRSDFTALTVVRPTPLTALAGTEAHKSALSRCITQSSLTLEFITHVPSCSRGEPVSSTLSSRLRGGLRSGLDR